MKKHNDNRRQLSGRVTLAAMIFTVLVALLVTIGLPSSSAAVSAPTGATVTTDYPDYLPGDTVHIDGSGFAPRETVSLIVRHVNTAAETDPISYLLNHETWSVVADDSGRIVGAWLVTTDCLGATLELTATGVTSGLVAKTTFTDGNLKVSALPSGSPKYVFNVKVTPCDAAGNPTGATTSVQIDNTGNTSITISANTGYTRIEADAIPTPALGLSFVNWTADASLGMTDVSPANPRIKVINNATIGSNANLTANYVAAQVATTTTVSATGITYGANGAVTVTVAAATGTASPTGNVQLSVDGGAPSLAALSSSGTGTSTASFTLAMPNAGTRNLTATYVPGGGSTFTGSTGTGTLAVAKANQTITWANPSNITYGTPLGATQLNATVAGVSGGSAAGALTYTPASGTVLNANADPLVPQTLSVTAAATSNYNEATKTVGINVLKAVATVTVTGYTGKYDGNAHGATGTATGVGGAALTGLSLGTTFTDVPGGTANWTFSNPNYESQGGSVAIVIEKAAATVSVSGYTGTYDAASHGATGSATGVGGAALSGLNLGGSFTNAPGGTATWTFSHANYESQNGSVAIVINKAVAVVSVTGYSGTYDAASHGASGSATGVDTGGAALGGTLSLGASFKDAPGGTASWSFAGGTNYTDQSGSVAITINKAVAVVTVTGYSGTYDAASHGASGSATGVDTGGAAAGGTLDLGESFTNAPGGTANWSFNGGKNYTNQNGSVAITINKAVAVVTVNGYSGTYDAAAHGASGSVTGVDTGGAALGGTLSLGDSFTNAPGGTASWTFTGGTNYTNQNGSVAIVINKAVAIVTVTGYSGTYDAAAHGASGSATGVDTGGAALGGTLSLGASFKDAPGGTANWNFAGGTNYTDQSGSVAITINKAVAVVSVTGYSGTYDAAAHGASGSVTGVDTGGAAAGGTLDLGESFTDVPGGTANWKFTGGTNYTDQSGSVNIVIGKAVATVSVNGYTGTFDGLSHGATGSVTGVPGDANAAGSSLSLGSSFTNVPGGTASWSFNGGKNYTDQSGSVAITINKANATVNVTGYTGTYDAQPHGASGTVTGVAADPTAAGSSLNLGSIFTDVPGGTANWSFNGGTNYNDKSGSVQIVINKAKAVINVTGYTGTYDAQSHGATGTATGVDNTDLSSLLSLGSAFTNVPGGTANWSFAGNKNYEAANGSVPIVINKANPTITVSGYNVTYDALPHTATGAAKGVSNETLAGLNLSGTVHTNAGTYADTWTFTDVTGNYNNASGSVTDTIAKASATIEFSALVQAYTGNPLRPIASLKRTTAPYPANPYPQANVTFTFTPSPVSPDNAPRAMGVYYVTAAVSDPNFVADPATALFVIYDATGGFVTGGGWINSPSNAITDAGAAILGLAPGAQPTGKANFGFNAKYQKGANIPTGNTEFQFQAGNLNFKSVSYDWLVVQGTSKAQFKGTGTINGAGSYSFMLTAFDGEGTANKPDAFRIKIWIGSTTIYDNQITQPDTSDMATVLGGGSIVIHDPGKK